MKASRTSVVLLYLIVVTCLALFFWWATTVIKSASNKALEGTKLRIHTTEGDFIMSQGKDGKPIYVPVK